MSPLPFTVAMFQIESDCNFFFDGFVFHIFVKLKSIRNDLVAQKIKSCSTQNDKEEESISNGYQSGNQHFYSNDKVTFGIIFCQIIIR